MAITWQSPLTVPSYPSGFSFSSIIWVPELAAWWACGTASSATSTNNLYTSTDGLTWVNVNPGFQKGYRAIAWSPDLGQLCALSPLSATGGTSTHVITTSDDGGATWVEHDIPGGSGYLAANASQFADLCWVGGAFQQWVAVAVVASLAQQVMTSPDGVTWTAVTAATGGGWGSVAATDDGSIVVALGTANSSSTNVMTSADGGATWTSRSTSGNARFVARSLSWGNGLFVAFADRNNGASSTDRCHVFTSPTGVIWTENAQSDVLANHGWLSAAWSGTQWLAVSQGSTGSPDFARSMTSPDGLTWTTVPDPLGINLIYNHVAYAPALGEFAAVEQGGRQISIGTGPPPLAIDAVVPDSGGTLGADPVTITGDGFVTGATVTFGGAAATDVVVVDAFTITCVIPAHAVGTVDVVVTNLDSSTGTLAGGFLYSDLTTTPTVNAGQSQVATGPAPSTVTTTATVTRGLNNGTITYAWTQVSGPATGAIATATTLNTDLTFAAYLPGSYVFQLAGTTEDAAFTATSELTIVIAPTVAPRVSSGGAQVSA